MGLVPWGLSLHVFGRFQQGGIAFDPTNSEYIVLYLGGESKA